MKLFNNKELDLLKNIDENKKEYINNDKNYIFSQVTEFIMSHGSKNGDITRVQKEYESIFRIVDVK